MKQRVLPGILLALSLLPETARAQVTTSQYDVARTGATLNETALTPQNVNPRQFGKLGAFKTDGVVFAQPLFVPGVGIPGKGKHDVLFVAAEHDSVYAFDAGRPNDPPLWQRNFLDDKQDVTTLSSHDVSCPFIEPEVGITSTPVIDMKSGTLYVLARTMIRHTLGSNEYFQHLHALAITTGAEKFGGPKLITASAPGKGDDSSRGQIAFNPLRENPRAALLLTNGNLFLMWASSCDRGPYHGWVMAYDPATLAQKAVLNVTPDGNEGGIWESDTGPAADPEGNVYVPTGNGTFNLSRGGRDYGDSVLKLGLEGSTLKVLDFFTPRDQEHMADTDMDLGSAGPLLVPDQPGPHRHLLLQPSKDKRIFVLDRDAMGKFHADSDAIVQTQPVSGGGYGAMAYWNGHAYFVGENDALREYAISGSELKPGGASRMKFAGGATPSISANGNKDAVVWIASRKDGGGRTRQAVLYAFDASNLGQPIYSSETNDGRDGAGMAARFVIPMVVNGRVYLHEKRSGGVWVAEVEQGGRRSSADPARVRRPSGDDRTMRRTTPRIVYDLDQGPADEGPADKAPAADHELPATKGNTMHYLLKTEPTVYSFANLQRDKTTIWDGVTNPAAVKHLREMKPGSQLLIYHTGDEKAVVGTAKVVSVDASNPKTPLVKIQAATPLRKAVTLADIKAHKLFTDSPLVRQGRLSVVPLSAEQWNWITRE